MAVLTKEQRNQLEKAVLKAREIAQIGASKALHTLGIGDPDPPAHLSPDQRELRRILRAQARQLGDSEDPSKKGHYNLQHLTEKVGYDKWHRMLFARFLAENELLISPKHSIPVSIDDCNELAPELGLRDGWEVASIFAAKMLPQIFRSDDPAGKIDLAPEDQKALEEQIAQLSRDTFQSDDALGWVYQFWQAKRKDEVNESGKKIGADELAPVTQLFTEHYMVLFLLHNTLGAWWAGKKMPKGGIVADTEEKARAAVALPGVNWEYLRFIKDEQAGTWQPAAGIFPGWPRSAKELKILDPCMGSGHFLVTEQSILIAMRVAEEAISISEAAVAVLRDNLFGLELDARCTQIAAFNLALAAWKTAGYQTLPSLNLACCGLGIYSSRESWLRLANRDERLQWGMNRLYDLFKDAPVLGSLIDPAKFKGAGFNVSFHELQPLLAKALAREETQRDDDIHELGITAEGITSAAKILASRFTLIATNVPFKESKQLVINIQEHIDNSFKDGRNNLATAFLIRILNLLVAGGSAAVVTPHEWLFLKTYEAIRKKMLLESCWGFLADLGEHAFESPQAAGAFVALISFTNHQPEDDTHYAGWELTKCRLPNEKSQALCTNEQVLVAQMDQLKNPDARIGLFATSILPLLSRYAGSYVGLQNGDTPRFVFFFWEVQQIQPVWSFFQLPCDETKDFCGREGILRWEEGTGVLLESEAAYIKGREAWGKQGIAIRQTRSLPGTRYNGDLYDQSSAAIIPFEQMHLDALWAYCSSKQFHDDVRRLDKKKNVTNATLVKVPFDLDHWQKVAAEKYPNGLPKPYSNDPTQWIFDGHPKGSDQPLQTAVARLLGYLWPRQTGSDFSDCPALGTDGLETYTDTDGIVCLHATKSEPSAAERLRQLLANAYGLNWSNSKQAELIEQVSYTGKTLEDWLRNSFFEQHCQLFHQRPFVWHIWDGLKNGFSVLVNYHKLDHTNLEKLTYTYLGDWIARQKVAVDSGEEGSDARLTAANELQRKLQLILEGERPYDIFIRWKPLKKQPIGWGPDLNDGVRLNIRPFITAGVLRKNPKISWSKDRGADVPSAPWYSKFQGERINDDHLALEDKRNARNK